MFVIFVLAYLCGIEVISVSSQGKDAPNVAMLDEPTTNIRQSLPLAFTDSTNHLSEPSFQCPHSFGDFHDSIQCDKFWRCEHGIASSRLCQDGLVFDINKADGRDDPCDSPYVVDCQERWKLQNPSLISKYCPRAHGYFAHPDPKVCNVFYTCIKGIHTETSCSHGLHFNESAGICDWPALAGRENCQENPKTRHSSGFVCPDGEIFNSVGLVIPHPAYPNPIDCQKFFVCLNGITPQEASCNLGQVFDERFMICDYPENVKECTDWYINDPRFSDYYYEEPTITTDSGKEDVIL